MAWRELDLAIAFARSWLAWRIDGSPRPLSAAFAITFRCNLRCSYCNTPFLKTPELALDEIELVLDRFAAIGVRRVGYAGGEPLLRDDLGEIVRRTRERGFCVTLNTNLTLYRGREAVFDAVDLVFTSLDGRRDAHIAHRGARSFDGVLEAIGDLVARGKPVVAIAVVTRENTDEIGALLAMAERIGFRVHFQPQSTGAECTRGTRSDELHAERERAFWTEVLAQKRAGAPIASSEPYLEELTRWSDFGVTALYRAGERCAAGRGFLYVDPAGRAYPCAFLKGKVAPVDLLRSDWREGFVRETPCTRCIAGPYLEFNALYQNPLRGALGLRRSYLRG
jgi:MoaA/NifB/PqqE/SkfB family radical SAM enzyme